MTRAKIVIHLMIGVTVMKELKLFVTSILVALASMFLPQYAFAAGLASTDFGTIQADVIATIGVAAAIGVAIMVVGLGWDVGISLVKKFAKKGAT